MLLLLGKLLNIILPIGRSLRSKLVSAHFCESPRGKLGEIGDALRSFLTTNDFWQKWPPCVPLGPPAHRVRVSNRLRPARFLCLIEGRRMAALGCQFRLLRLSVESRPPRIRNDRRGCEREHTRGTGTFIH